MIAPAWRILPGGEARPAVKDATGVLRPEAHSVSMALPISPKSTTARVRGPASRDGDVDRVAKVFGRSGSSARRRSPPQREAEPRLELLASAHEFADGFVARGMSKCALVIGAEEMTRLMDVNRTYAMVSSVISRLDDLRGTAIRRLADVA